MEIFNKITYFLIFLLIIGSLQQQSVSKPCTDSWLHDDLFCINEQQFPCCNYENKTRYCCDVEQYLSQYIVPKKPPDSTVFKNIDSDKFNFEKMFEYGVDTDSDKDLRNLNLDDKQNFDFSKINFGTVDLHNFEIEKKPEGFSHSEVLRGFFVVIGIFIILVSIIRHIRVAGKAIRNRETIHQDEQRLQSPNNEDLPDNEFNIIIVSQRCIVPPSPQPDNEVLLAQSCNVTSTRTNSLTPQDSSLPPYENCEVPPPSYDEAVKDNRKI